MAFWLKGYFSSRYLLMINQHWLWQWPVPWAISHQLNPCWTRYIKPYGVTSLQCVNKCSSDDYGRWAYLVSKNIMNKNHGKLIACLNFCTKACVLFHSICHHFLLGIGNAVHSETCIFSSAQNAKKILILKYTVLDIGTMLFLLHMIQVTEDPGRLEHGLNPLGAKFFRGNTNIYLHFMSFLRNDITQVVEILPQVRQGTTYST